MSPKFQDAKYAFFLMLLLHEQSPTRTARARKARRSRRRSKRRSRGQPSPPPTLKIMPTRWRSGPLAAKNLVDHVRIGNPRDHQHGSQERRRRAARIASRCRSAARYRNGCSWLRSVSNMMANPATLAAAAGLGSPRKVMWSSSSLRLDVEPRQPQGGAGRERGGDHPHRLLVKNGKLRTHLHEQKRRRDRRTDTMSHRLSNSAPNSLAAFASRAM